MSENVLLAINYESLAIYAKFGGAMLGILMLVWVIALITPKLAKIIDKLMGKPADPSPERVQEVNEDNYKVYSLFEDRPDGAKSGLVENNDKSDDTEGE
ncbi:MAG: hypothetical protein J6A05_06515 [Oscillospiraceae bacterium]|nr:hypothetical protein [Oscillospiraceae bacterium]